MLEEQQETIKALSSPSIYPERITSVNVKQTALSILFITQKFVYKLKKSLQTPQTDFSTPAKRKLACIQEMKRSTIYAPNLITGIKPVRRLKNGRIKIGGQTGEEIDTVLVMHRLDEKDLLENILNIQDFPIQQTLHLAEEIVYLHDKAKIFRTKGGVHTLKNILQESLSFLKRYPDIFNSDQVYFWGRTTLAWLNQNTKLINFRQKSGRFRKCHGNLILSNIAFNKKDFLFFSPIEYNENLECIDVLYDLSALLMDLEATNHRLTANIIFNYYISATNDIEGLPVLGLYQSMRAISKATSFIKEISHTPEDKEEVLQDEAKKYFKLGFDFLKTSSAYFIVLGGLNNIYKNSIANSLASLTSPAPGALIIKEENVKKQIMGISNQIWFNKTYGSSELKKIVQHILLEQAKMVIKMGISVILETEAPLTPDQQDIVDFSAKTKIPSFLFWLGTQNTKKNQFHTPTKDWEILNPMEGKKKTLSLIQETINSILHPNNG